MKKTLMLLSSSMLLSVGVYAETPINAGDIHLLIKPIGTTSVAARYAVSDKLGVIGQLDYFDLSESDYSEYNAATENYDKMSHISDPNIALSMGAQYFFHDGVYLTGEAGFFYHLNEENFESAATADEDFTYTRLFGSMLLGFEHPLSDRLSVLTEVEFEIGKLSSEYIESDSNGDQTGGETYETFYTETQFALGLSYQLN